MFNNCLVGYFVVTLVCEMLIYALVNSAFAHFASLKITSQSNY